MDLASLERRIKVLEDKEEIKQLKHRYCCLCDNTYDADALAELFTEDAVWDGKERGKNNGSHGRPGHRHLVFVPTMHIRRREPSRMGIGPLRRGIRSNKWPMDVPKPHPHIEFLDTV